MIDCIDDKTCNRIGAPSAAMNETYGMVKIPNFEYSTNGSLGF
jgi:hypothetical protein